MQNPTSISIRSHAKAQSRKENISGIGLGGFAPLRETIRGLTKDEPGS
jgi:hypothetical protein